MCHSYCSVDILDRQALGISNIIRKLILFFPPPLLITMPSDLLQSFFEQLTQLTCRFSEGAAQEELVGTLNIFFVVKQITLYLLHDTVFQLEC